MPQSTDLEGHGMPWPLAGALGNDPDALTATGTTQGGAASIPVNTRLVSVTAATSATGVILPSNAKIGDPYFISGVGTAAPVVYAPSTQYLNGSQNGSVTLSAAGASGIFVQMALNKWFSFPLAP